MKLWVLIVLVLLFAAALFAILYMSTTYLQRQKRMSERQKFQKYNKRFRFYYDFVLTRQTFRKIHGQIGGLSVYNFMEARVMTVKFYERSMLSAVVMFLIGFIGLGDLVSGIVLMMFSSVMLNTTVNKRIDDVNFSCLKSTSQLLLSIRECYTRVRNVPDAINDAKCPTLLQRTVDNIYLICTANDAQERLNRFYQECPNRILRTLATTCYIRSDTGEEDLDHSPFKDGLGLIKDEVDMEVRRQVNQRLMFNALDKLPFIPLFLYPLIKMFYVNMISATAAVFESAVGYVIKLVVVLTCFACYYVLSTMNNASVARTDDRLLSLVHLMQNHKIERFARTLVIRNNKKRLALEKKLDGCISQKDIQYFYFEKFVFSFVVCVASIIFSIMITISARSSVYNSLAASTMSVTLTYTPEQEKLVREYDAQVLAMDACPSEEELTDRFQDIFVKGSSLVIESQVQRIKDKYRNYHNLHYHWWYAFIYIACWFAGWFIPNILLGLRAKLVKSEAELDVLQLQTIIAILMDTNLDTLSVIYWLAKSSDIHKDILTFCYHEYVRDPEMALTRLRKKSAIPEFSSMCDKLITTIHQVTLKEAFEDLIAERDNTMKVREVVQLDALKSKRNLAGPIATAPMMVWMVAVFIVPLAIVAVKSAISMLGNLNI